MGHFEAGVAEKLKALSDAGTRLAFLNGNRDFLLGNDFCQRASMQMLRQPYVLELYGTPTVLLHGDQLCTLDIPYQRYRRRVSNPEWQQRMLARPIWFRRSVAALLRLASRLRNRSRDAESMDVVASEADALFGRTGAERMIHGHTHRPGRHVHTTDEARCERIVLGDWYTQGSVLTVSPDSVVLQSLERDFS